MAGRPSSALRRPWFPSHPSLRHRRRGLVGRRPDPGRHGDPAADDNGWLMLALLGAGALGISFVVAAYLQVVQGYDAIQTGAIFTAATLGLLTSSLAAERLARRRPQRTLIMAGFGVTIAGTILVAGITKTPERAYGLA